MVSKPFDPFRRTLISLFSSRRAVILGVFLGFLFAGCSPSAKSPAEPVTVFAAASLTDALGEIATAYEQTSGQAARLSFGGSGAVARQVQSGAPADVVVLADQIWMNRLQTENLLAAESRVDLLRNHLVLIARAGAKTDGDPFAWLSRTQGKLVIGDPESVPAGAYARAWLQKTGQWDRLQARIVTAADVRSVRTFVERGEAGLGVVYRSDTVGAPAVKVVAEPAVIDQPVILYPAAATRLGGERAVRFMAFLRGAEARRIFVAHGFDPLP